MGQFLTVIALTPLRTRIPQNPVWPGAGGGTMRTELFTVSKIFTESLYRIPDYQRGYSWQDEHLRDFWLDLEQLQPNAKHYTGVLTLEEVPEHKWKLWEDDIWIIQSRRYKPYYIVDGQQRLTTIVILLQSILQLDHPSNLNFTSRGDLRRKYIADSKPEDSAKSFLFGYEKDNPSYEFLKKRILLEQSDVHLPDEATIYTKNLLGAKQFFEEKIAELNDTELESLFTKLTQQLVFNVYEIAADIDVFVAFETMNNRGKPLSTLELLKNRLIYLSTKLPEPEGRDGLLRRMVNDAWKSAYHYLGKNEKRPLDDDIFLRTNISQYYVTRIDTPSGDEESQAKARRRHSIAVEDISRFLLGELFTPKRLVTNGGMPSNKSILPPLTRDLIRDFSQQMKDCVELFYKLSTPADSRFPAKEQVWIERIGRLVGYSPSTMLLSLFKNEQRTDVRVRLLEALERFQFLLSLGYRAPYTNYRTRLTGPDFYVGYACGTQTTESVIVYLNNIVTELLKETPLVEFLHDWIKNSHNGYYGWRSVRYFMFEFEQHLQHQARSEREKLDWDIFSREHYEDDYETIEHIYPQRARDSYWTQRFSKFGSSQKRQLRNSLGNLLPLARPRNSSLGNRPYPEKLGDDKNHTGYRYGCYSENQVATIGNWGATQILERGVMLLDFMEQRWKFPIGDRSQKIKALGFTTVLLKLIEESK